MKRCKFCNAPLVWPFVQFSEKQRKIFYTIYSASTPIKNYAELGKLCGISESTARSEVSRIKVRLRRENERISIIPKPLRVVLIKEPRYPCSGQMKITHQ